MPLKPIGVDFKSTDLFVYPVELKISLEVWLVTVPEMDTCENLSQKYSLYIFFSWTLKARKISCIVEPSWYSLLQLEGNI